MRTLDPFWMSQKQTFDKFVLFPTPFTPTNTMLYGSRCCVEGKGDESLDRIESKTSVDVLGVRIRVNDVDNACRTVALIATKAHQYVNPETR